MEADEGSNFASGSKAASEKQITKITLLPLIFYHLQHYSLSWSPNCGDY